MLYITGSDFRFGRASGRRAHLRARRAGRDMMMALRDIFASDEAHSSDARHDIDMPRRLPFRDSHTAY